MYFYQTGDRFDGKNLNNLLLKVKGEWANNVKEGFGVYYYVDGSQFSGKLISILYN